MGDNENHDPSEPRQPRNVKGLLRFCMEATKAEDAPSQTSEMFEPMSEERKIWLAEALSKMSVSPSERMSISLEIIENSEKDTEEGTEAQIKAIEEIQQWAEEYDSACDFIKMRGLRVVPQLLSSEVSQLRWAGLELLATLAQNNPFTQAAILQSHLLPVFIAMADSDDHPTVRVKAIYAVSCLVRSNATAQASLLTTDGLGVLVRALKSDNEKIKIKATFLMSALCGDNPAFKDGFLNNGAIEQLATLLKSTPHCSLHEHLMAALVAIVTDNADARERCLQEALDFKTFLCKRMRDIKDQEEWQEEHEHALNLLNVLNAAPPAPQPSQQNSQLMLSAS